MAVSTALRAASKRTFDSLMAEEFRYRNIRFKLHKCWTELTCTEFDGLHQGGHVLLHLLISLTAAAAAAQDLYHVPVDPVCPGQGVPVHLNRAYLLSTRERIIRSSRSKLGRTYLNRWRSIVAVPKLSFVSSAHLLVVLQHAHRHAALQVALNVLHIG